MKKLRQLNSTFQAGVVDVGAHSIRLDIFEVTAGGRIDLLESLSRSVNLGHDVFRYGSVSPENLARLSRVMSDFSRKLDEYRVQVFRVVATSAIREAFNRELVVNRIRNDAHLNLEILEAPEEIKISFVAMRDLLRQRMDFDHLSGICLIIGAGSLLVSYFEGGLMRFSEEAPLGTIRLFDSYGSSGLSVEQVIETLRSQDLGQRMYESVGLKPKQPISLIAMGASVRALTSRIAGIADSEWDEEDCLMFEPNAVAPALRRIMNSDPARLSDQLKLSEEESASLTGCAGILTFFLDEFNCKRFLSPGTTTRSALIHDLIRQSRDPERLPFHDDLIAICDAIGRKYGYDESHSDQVAKLCGKLFNKLKRTFDFAPRSELLLEAAARLHDIGRFVDTRQHHKHTYYLISNTQLPGISAEELRIIATISRYHRKSVPKDSHQEYMMLSADDKVTVLKLSAILRVADALDCSRRNRFEHMKLSLRGHVLSIIVPESGDFRPEQLHLDIKGGLFTQVFGLDLKIEEAPLL